MSLAEHVLLKEYDLIVGVWSRYTRAKGAMVVSAICVTLLGILAKLSGGYPAEMAPVAVLGMLLQLHFINYLDLRTTTLKRCLAHTEERLAALAPELSAEDAFFRYYNRLNRRNLVLQSTALHIPGIRLSEVCAGTRLAATIAESRHHAATVDRCRSVAVPAAQKVLLAHQER